MERDIYFKRGNISLWEPQWIERCPDTTRFEDVLIERLDGEEKEELITVDLSFLPKRQSEAIQMVADGLSYTQAAEMMDQVKKGTVSKHLQLARKKCQESVQLSWNL
jgi:DNA-directed RNA polymerase specialized sigma24 family protein